MSWRAKVVWSSGMFLQPHHFQQETRYLERLVDARARCLSPFAWGFADLELDEGLLALGKVGLTRASGMLPDGTPFAMPQLDPLPAPLEISPDVKGELIYLALPLQREGLNEVDFANGSGDGELARFTAIEEEVRDNTDASDEPTTIQTGKLRLRLVRAKEAGEAYALLGVAFVAERRSDGQVTLERHYIAPQVAIDATAQLSASASLLHGLIQQRAQHLASRMGQLSHGVSEMADFLMLQTLNRNEPIFSQHAATPVAHPRELHGDCLRLAGDLATLSSSARRPPEFPPYRHDDLARTFTPVFDALRGMLTAVLEQKAIQVELVDRKHGVRTAVVSDIELARNATFYLAVNAQLSHEQLRQRFPAQTKVGPPEKIRDLVNLQLPGISLAAQAVAPRELPFHDGFFYFKLERGGELWKPIEQNGSFAMHTAGDFPGLELELWAVRK
ncbi:type VI secretion system baseplate subunit TssK [Rhizobacter sp. J219]|uniref:type VI secretion system baseplate subunit TssK n=1 Tax=Rhizobacter sp. J219 TaxID=2898430 RepID=UPI00215077E4|nr:type VI secretion system baseplate subunit TssK [Rhizobacter sp. J219]MCR5882496.1 type VI secretion system baseplate subunit TssK [Rhizobacter sp. J219]